MFSRNEENQSIKEVIRVIREVCTCMAGTSAGWELTSSVEGTALNLVIKSDDVRLSGLFIGSQGRRVSLLRLLANDLMSLHMGARWVVRIRVEPAIQQPKRAVS